MCSLSLQLHTVFISQTFETFDKYCLFPFHSAPRLRKREEKELLLRLRPLTPARLARKKKYEQVSALVYYLCKNTVEHF